ncbi:MAG TPA: DmsE family decaheme c-type cytochrome [Noviherbaspirillum sp.]|nr:DmsE family decaheme c-type cytochrome [Noviherbaspirillum sp.]
MKIWQKIATSLALAVGLAGFVPAHAEEAQKHKHSQLDMMRELRAEDAVCTRCHDQSEKNPVLSIYQTRHGVKADSRTPSCQACHGASEAHVKNTANTSVRPPVDFLGAKGKATAKDIESCIGCHKNGARSHWAGSAHESRDVLCTNCHQMHTHQDKVRNKATQPEVCFACHKEQRAQYSRPSRHLMSDGKMACSDCHNPHGSAGPRLLQRDSVTDTCYTCHMEKRGPFVRNHQPVQEDCTICHNPHGTTTPNLLKSRPPFLCQQCHEPSTHQGNAATLNPAAGLYSSSQNTLARGCINCHTNIHGSNNPTLNSASSRAYRR